MRTPCHRPGKRIMTPLRLHGKRMTTPLHRPRKRMRAPLHRPGKCMMAPLHRPGLPLGRWIMANAARDYYAGGFRVMLHGVPLRLARKPSPENLADMRRWRDERGTREYESAKDRSKRLSQEKDQERESYGLALGLSYEEVIERVNVQRLHL